MSSKEGKQPVFQKDFDNSRYTVNISEEELSKYTENDYLSYEKKMDQISLCNVSEQRCKPFFCSYQNCFSIGADSPKCKKLYYLMTSCINKERKKVIYEYITSGKQPIK